MGSLALAHFTLTPNADGTITLGGVTLPAWAARDLAARLYAAAGDVPEEVAGRIRVRAALDRAYRDAVPIHVRDMQTGAVGRFPALRDGRRLTVRLGDSVTATLLAEGSRWRGFGIQHRDDPLFGVVGEVMRPFQRFSADGRVVLQLRERV